MTSKFSPQHQNILQPKRLNTSTPEVCAGSVKDPKADHRQQQQLAGMISGPTLTLNGVTIGLPTSVSSGAFGTMTTTTCSKKGSSSTMAKRNARERNRVKQVNLGFQTLRQHIPESYRLKKMSKVDTLRCAVEYIRSMEQILEITPIPCTSAGDNSLMMTSLGSPYHSFSSPSPGESMNQAHLDKICSVEDGGMSLEQSYSSASFSSEIDEENPECSPVRSASSLHHQNSINMSSIHHHHHQRFTEERVKEEQDSNTIVTSGDGNSIPLQALGTASGTTEGPLILPLQIHSHHHHHHSQMDKDQDEMLSTTDENFNPPPPPSFIRVVEIVQLQS